MAVVDRKEAGPQFGADGLKILLQDGRQRCAQSRLGRSPPPLPLRYNMLCSAYQCTGCIAYVPYIAAHRWHSGMVHLSGGG